MIEAAIAVGFIDHRSGQVVHERVRFLKVSALHAAVLLFIQCHVVIAQAVLHRQLARDFPAVLDVSGERMISQPHIGDLCEIHRIRVTE